MGTDPDPDNQSGLQEPERPVVISYTHGYQILAALYPAVSQRWVTWIRSPQMVVFNGQALNVLG